MKTTWKTMNGSIYSPNHIGHELIICQQLDGQSTNVAFSPIRHDGYDYLIAKIYCNGELDTLREALLKIREVATPLPIRTLTTVRIPFRMGCAAAGAVHPHRSCYVEDVVGGGMPVYVAE